MPNASVPSNREPLLIWDDISRPRSRWSWVRWWRQRKVNRWFDAVFKDTDRIFQPIQTPYRSPDSWQKFVEFNNALADVGEQIRKHQP